MQRKISSIVLSVFSVVLLTVLLAFGLNSLTAVEYQSKDICQSGAENNDFTVDTSYITANRQSNKSSVPFRSVYIEC